MATLHPFRALRPRSDRAEEVACVPYDVVDASEARALAKGRPWSFLHVIRPEIDLPEGIDEHADAVYEKGADNLRKYARSDVSVSEEAPSLYVYRLVMDGREQTGLFGCVAVDDYDRDVILKHELTRPVKEDDRTRHIVSQRAHAEPVMLTYRDDADVDALVGEAMRKEPLYDFEAVDGVRHTLWRIEDPSRLEAAFDRIPKLYVADGHHRCKAASRAAHELRDGSSADSAEEFEYFPAVLFPMGQMHIMAYNRVVHELPRGTDRLLVELEENFKFEKDSGQEAPSTRGQVGVYLNQEWHTLHLPPSRGGTAADDLDVARLSEHVLAPLLGIEDPRRDPNLSFVGGIRGTDELERLVDGGHAAVAFSLYPTDVRQLVEVSDRGLLMPPKSTWFEPKLRSGLLVHLFD